MRTTAADRGFTLVELLVVMSLFSVVSVGFYQVMFSGVRGNETAQDVATIAQEARLGLNRMIRDTREASGATALSEATGTSYKISVLFPGSTTPEEVTYSYNDASDTIRLNGEVLIEGVEPVAGLPIFSYSSNNLEYDWDGDGKTTLAELEDALNHGVTLAANKLIYVSNIDYAFQIRSGGRVTEYFAQAQLRNRR